MHSSFGYSFVVQSGWHIVPDTLCKQRIEELKKMNLDVPSFEYAVQLNSANIPFERPYIIIRHLKTGKLNQLDIKKMTNPFKMKTSFEIIKKEVDEITKGIVVPLKINCGYYDKLNKIIHFVTVSNIKDIGLTINYQALILTNYGYVQFFGSSLIEHFDNIITTFNNFIQSITIDKVYAY